MMNDLTIAIAFAIFLAVMAWKEVRG